MPQFNEEKQNKRLAEIRHREEEQLVQETALKIGETYIDLTGVGVDTDALRIVDENRSRKEEVAAFKIIGDKLHLAARSPQRENVVRLKKELEENGYEITLYMVSSRSLEKAWDRYEDISMASASRGSFLDISESALEELGSAIKTNEDVVKMFSSANEDNTAHRISRLIEIIFGSAIALKASDIHIEPQEAQVRLRYREDGVLHDILFFEHDTYKMINSRIKLLSGLMLTQTQNAQDGRFTIDFQGKQIEIRTSVIPGGYGESIVMRLLNPDNINVGLEDLGIEPKLLDVLKKEIEKPNGLILTTGPTGSGKTTTLYSFLKEVYNPEIKILTIEDPIEYHLQGITQTQIDHEKGYDFLSGLRAALRQDPDVVMVGEIRDGETANIAVNASLTGHLVLSTLHTNNAAGAIPRLLDLGVDSGILSSALSVSIAQRLVRKLCVHCKEQQTPTPEQEALLRRVLKQAAALNKDLAAYGITPDQTIMAWKPVGCEHCGGFGYKGRIGVFEAILNDKKINELLERRPSEREVKIVASEQGILSMKEDGVLKILSGITSMEEVLKVVDLDEDIDLLEAIQAAKKDNLDMSDFSSDLSDTSTSENITDIPAEETISSDIADLQPLSEITLDNESADPGDLIEKSENDYINESMENKTNSERNKQREIDLLVDYLKMLEDEQRRNPTFGISKQIQNVQETIVNLLKSEPETSNNKQEEEQRRVHSEVLQLMQDLKKIEHEQMIDPDVGVADKLSKIRATVENL